MHKILTILSAHFSGINCAMQLPPASVSRTFSSPTSEILCPFKQYVFSDPWRPSFYTLYIVAAVSPSYKGGNRVFIFVFCAGSFIHCGALKVYLGCVRISFLFLCGFGSLMHMTDFAYLFICWGMLGCFSLLDILTVLLAMFVNKTIPRISTFSLCICKQDF